MLLPQVGVLARIAEIKGNDTNMYLRVLHWLGAIDAFPPIGNDLRSEVTSVVERHFKERITGHATWAQDTISIIERWSKQANKHDFWSRRDKFPDPEKERTRENQNSAKQNKIGIAMKTSSADPITEYYKELLEQLVKERNKGESV